jgi:hypothetical protein
MAKVDPETGQLLTARGQPFKPLKTQPIRDYIAATAGRPREYHPTMDEMARKFCLLGCTDEQLGKSFDVGEATVQHWMREHPTFLSSVKSGRAEADANVAASLYHRANGYSHKAEKIAFNKDGEALRTEYTEHYPPDAASAIFWLKNRRRDLWRDNPQVVIQNNTQVVSSNADPVEIGQSYRALMDESE